MFKQGERRQPLYGAKDMDHATEGMDIAHDE